jgi:hypothetical protein
MSRERQQLVADVRYPSHMARPREAGVGAPNRQPARPLRLFAIGASSLALAGCAELLDLPDDPRLVDNPTERVSSDTIEATEPIGSDGAATGGDSLVVGTMGSEASLAPVLASPEAPASGSAGTQANTALADAGPDGGADSTGDELADGGGSDAGLEADEPAEPPCEGQPLFGICWYHGAFGDTCEETCATHGGPSPLAPEYVGSPQQGGSRAECSAILTALGADTPAVTATRFTGGVGCHTFGANGNPFWLTFPSFDPGDSVLQARIACGCVR